MYEVAIIGAGAAGIDCAKKALQAGLKTLLIEEDKDSSDSPYIDNLKEAIKKRKIKTR